MISRQIESIFCDDIREEVNGKLSFVGVYLGTMSVPEFPITLPKFAIFVRVILPIAEGFVGNVQIQALHDDDVIGEQEISSDELKLEQKNLSEQNVPLLQCSTAMVFSPFVIDAPCVIRVRVKIDESEHRAAGLRICLAQ